ncbi:MAG: hypothetical protein JO194_01080 [Candidatus Eremiobacteraeota bacterium]|nr:hypothetical protein [Candidatus Eremiobacteraeota bacterium]
MISIPPPPPARTYVSNPAFVSGTAGVQVYQMPLTASSTPAFTLGPANGIPLSPSALAVDKAHNLYVLDDGASSIFIFSQPISATSTPAVTLGPIPGTANDTFITLDAAGDIWMSSSATSTIYEFSPPFATGVPAPALVINTTVPALNNQTGITFDTTGRMFVANQLAGQVLVFNPPFANGMAAIATITSPGFPEGVAFDVKDQMYVSDFTTGNVYAFKPPFATGITPAFHIAPPVVSGGTSGEATFIATDSSFNLYVPYGVDGAHGNLSVFAPPFSGASTPVLSLPGIGNPSNIAIGP